MMIKFKMPLLVAFLSLLLPTTIQAAPVDATAAHAAAAQFMQSSSARQLKGSHATNMLLTHVEQSTVEPSAADYYVFNTSNGSAFVVVAGDDRAEGILAYGDGTLDVENLPCNLQWMLDYYREQLEYLLARPEAHVRRVPPYNDVTIAPMLTCNWSQSEPYNLQCPTYDGELCVTGCIATAMAQVMYYWRYPDNAPALQGFRTQTLGIWVPSLPAAQLDWDNMQDSYSIPYTQAQGDAVARLMRYCGQSSDMDYSPSGSGTYVHNQLHGMRSFGYSYDGMMLEKSDYDIEVWDALMQQDLLGGRPILYSGSNGLFSGHAFVLDGYCDGKYHINWGWGGTGNGYFALEAFSVMGTGYNSRQQMLHNIHPGNGYAVEQGYDFVSDGFYYRLNEQGKGVLVTYKDTKFNNYSGNVVIPSTANYNGMSLPVVGIAPSAFRNCKGLTGVTIPATVKTVGQYAFRNCFELEQVNIPDEVFSIGIQAFANCMKLASVSLPANLKYVGSRAFEECNSLTTVNIGSLESWLGITFTDEYSNPLSIVHHLTVNGHEIADVVIPGHVSTVGPYAFYGCTGLSSLTLENGVTAIGASALEGCTSLTDVSLPGTLTSLGKYAFSGCTGLTSVDLPSSLTKVGTGTFESCTSLSSVNIPSTVTAIGDDAFYSCTSLTSVTLPAELESIGAGAFARCKSLKTLIIPNSVTSMGEEAFLGCSKLASVQISRMLSVIPSQAFSACQALKTVTIPDAVQTIGRGAFDQCPYLTDVTIGSGVQVIESMAFYNNPRIKTVTCQATTPPQMDDTNTFMRSIYKSATLRVPADKVADYKNTGLWSWFVNIKDIVDDVPGDVNHDGEVTVADVNIIIDAIMMQVSNADCDVNGDGEISVADVNFVTNIIIAGQ